MRRALVGGAGVVAGGGLMLLTMFGAALAGGTLTPETPAPTTDTCPGGICVGYAWDPGNIISDQVFFNTAAITETQIRDTINSLGAACARPVCLRNITATVPPQPATPYCAAFVGGADLDAAAILTGVAVACGINPQVLLVTLQKESQLVTRIDPTLDTYTAGFGWNCPDTGPNGTANCDPDSAGFVNQTLGVATQFARYRTTPENYTYQAGHTAQILWNVAETGCGGADVTIANTATAALYNYTPYRPNPAAISAYPGAGDGCSSYGNRNFFYLFQQWFGPTGGGTPQPATGGPITVDGVTVTLPTGPDVDPQVAGKTITAPTPAVAAGIAAALATVGMPYVWGGGTDGGPPDQGCQRGGGSKNSCQGLVGFDCSGLTAYALAQAGHAIPTNSGGQRTHGTNTPRAQALPGDIIGYPGHVALYLGRIDGTDYLLEAPDVGTHIHIRTAYWTTSSGPADTYLHRYWN